MLAIGVLAVGAGCTVQYGLPYLIPELRAQGYGLAQAGVLAACPIAGLLLTLLAWGAAADRWGERRVLTAGLGAGGIALLAGTGAGGMAGLATCLILAGAATAAVHAASGRLVLGWFAAEQRGVAMAVRQTAQPLGVATAALVLPSLSGGLAGPLLLLAGLCLGAALLVVALVRDPARPAATDRAAAGSPYRTAMLWRLHGSSSLLVVPQFVVATFALVYLVDEQGWTASGAGRLLAAAQVGGAAARLGAGFWSDRAGSRLRPMRVLAAATAVVAGVLALGAATGSAVAIVVLVVAAAVTVSTNGLAFTAVAERAGSAWAGRALGVQNTAQNLVAAGTPPAFALLIGAGGYATAFAAAAAFPVAACALVPVTAEAGFARPDQPRPPRGPSP